MSIQTGVDVLVVVTTEQIDYHTALDFRRELREGLRRCLRGPDPSPELVVDLSQVTFLDSTGVRELILTEGMLAHRGGRLVVCGAKGGVRRCLEITGVLERFGGAPTNREPHGDRLTKHGDRTLRPGLRVRSQPHKEGIRGAP